jgi:hypothetical protein
VGSVGQQELAQRVPDVRLVAAVEVAQPVNVAGAVLAHLVDARPVVAALARLVGVEVAHLVDARPVVAALARLVGVEVAHLVDARHLGYVLHVDDTGVRHPRDLRE